MKTITTTVYNFDELSDDAKQTARDWYRECSSHDDWWEAIYEDAANAGLRIKSFDLDRNRHATGEFSPDAYACAKRIIRDHGKDCETFKTATAFLAAFELIGEEDTEALNACEEDFLKSILEDYSILLQREYEYLYSDESVDENISVNEHTFDVDGNREG